MFSSRSSVPRSAGSAFSPAFGFLGSGYMKEAGFNYQIRKSAKRKTLAITVHPDNRVVVSAPATCSNKNILRFVEDRSNWVRKVIQANLQRVKQDEVRKFETGQKLLYLGSRYILRVEGGTSSQVILEDGHICVRLPVEDLTREPSGVRKHLIDWYMACALAKVKEKLPVLANKIGVEPRSVTVKSMKSRWGSCSVHGRISLAWNIIMAPEPVLDYLVVHELCHLLHHDHSPEYWKLVSSVFPAHKEKRRWLRENGNCLWF